MDGGFDAMIAPWHDFYLLAGTAAATLIGLIFVALSLNPQVMADEGPVGLRAWAGQTFSSFLVVLIIALVCLIPGQTGTALGITLVAIAVQGLVRGGFRLRDLLTDPDPTWRSRHALWRFVAPTAGYVAALLVGLDMVRGGVGSLDWLLAVVFPLLSSAAGAAWELLSEMGRQQKRAAREAAAVER